MTLSARMLEAADTIEQLNAMYALGQHCPWEPRTLRVEAEAVAWEEHQKRQSR